MKRDSLGRRTDRVKGREARLMLNRAGDGYDPTEIAKEFGRDLRTVKTYLSLRLSPELKKKQGEKVVTSPRHLDPELGPHGRELFYFLRCLRDRIFLTSPDRLQAPAMVTGAVDFISAADRRSMRHPADMWKGRALDRTLDGKPVHPEEQRVESEWGLLLYDARQHSLYASFYQHFQGHTCLELLDAVQRERSAYLEEVQMWWADERGLREAYRVVRRAIQEFQHALSPDALLRKLILNGRCELCPLAGPGVPEGVPGVIACVPTDWDRV